jgi:hypothetical protein
VLALALVIRKPVKERREVGVLGVGLEADRPAAVEVLKVSFVASTVSCSDADSFDAFGIATS